MRLLISATLFAATMATAAYAQGLELTNEVMVEVVTVDENGNEVVEYLPADRATPGDTVKYRISYTNAAEAPAEGIVLTSQIPPAVLFIEGSAETEAAQTEYSIDGGQSFAEREDLVVVNEKGEERPAEAADLTNIRWTVAEPVPAGETGEVSYLATVK